MFSESEGALLQSSDVDEDVESEIYSSNLQNLSRKNSNINGDVVLFKRSNDRSRIAFNAKKAPSYVDTVKRPSSSSFVKRVTKSGRLHRSLLLFSAFLGLGLCIALPGPTLLDLEERTKSTTDQISFLFAGRSVGYLSGSVTGGILFERLNPMLLLGFSLFLTGVATLIFPWASTLILAIVLIGFQGFSMGILDTGGNTYCIRLWGRQSPPYLQGLHFAFGVGAFLAPIIAEPFLSTAPVLVSRVSAVEGNAEFASQVVSRQRRAVEQWSQLDGNLYNDYQNNDFRFTDYHSIAKKGENVPPSPQLAYLPVLKTTSPVIGNKTAAVTVASTATTVLAAPSTPKIESDPETTTTDFLVLNASISPSTTTLTMNSSSTAEQLTKNTNETTTTLPPSDSTTQSSSSTSTTQEFTQSTVSNGSETTTIRHKPSVNEGTLLNRDSAIADGSINEGQIKKETIAKGGSDVPLHPLPALPVAPTPSSTSTSSSSSTTEAVVNLGSPNSTLSNSTDIQLPNVNLTIPVADVINETKTETPLNETSLISSTTQGTTTTTSATTTTSTTTVTTPPTTSTTTTQPLPITQPTIQQPVQQQSSTPAPPVPSTSTTSSTTSTTTTTALEFSSVSGKVSRIQIAYMIVSIIISVVAVAFILIGISERCSLLCSDRLALVESQSESGLYRASSAGQRSVTPLSEQKLTDDLGTNTNSLCPSGFHIQLLVLLFIFYFLYVGGEVSFGQFISPYAEKAQKWSRQEAAYAASCFWGALAAGRGVAIPLSRYLRPASMIAIDLTLLTVAMFGLLMGAQSFDTALWFCAAVAGFGMSSIFASGFSWTERYIPITAKISSILIVGAAIGEMVLPVLAGFLFARNPLALGYLMSAVSLLLAVLFVLLQNLALNGQDDIHSQSRNSTNRFNYDNENDHNENETIMTTERQEAVRLLPTGTDSLADNNSPGSANNNEAIRRSGVGSSASGHSSLNRKENEDARNKAALYDIFDDKDVRAERKLTTLQTNGSAVLIGDDDSDDGNENFYDAFPVIQHEDKDKEVLLLDRRNLQQQAWHHNINKIN